MTIISKRARQKAADQALEVEVFSPSIIIIDGGVGGAQMSPDEIRRAEEVFKEIRRQLDAIGEALTP